MRLWMSDQYGDWAFPFKRVTLTGKTCCRLCDGKASKELYNIQVKEGLDFDPKADHNIKTDPMMKKGDEALRLVTTSGPTGTAYICLGCGGQLLDNLRGELDNG